MDLPTSLLDRFRLLALEGMEHVERFGGPWECKLKIFRQDDRQPLQFELEIVKQRWRE